MTATKLQTRPRLLSNPPQQHRCSLNRPTPSVVMTMAALAVGAGACNTNSATDVAGTAKPPGQTGSEPATAKRPQVEAEPRSRPSDYDPREGGHYQPEFSTAGFFQLDPKVRSAIDFNPGWRFFKGGAAGAHEPDFDDSKWQVVNLPHGLEILPLDASGGRNYQGEAWYRKRFVAPAELAGKRTFLHFEAIMGKSRVWVNGQQLTEHFGGYLPLHLDITKHLKPGAQNVVSVRANNEDDPSYPPGKPQSSLDFTYFGGIYRDAWLVTTGPVHITNANAANVVAGGGLFFRTLKVDASQARAACTTHIANTTGRAVPVTVRSELIDPHGASAATALSETTLRAHGTASVKQKFEVAQPSLWHPDHPFLYDLRVTVTGRDGSVLDTLRHRVGLRTVELRGREGWLLNGKRFDGKLVGANRHQDFAYLGNALPNITHWRDAKKLRSAGMRIIRAAHYPQDPAFMDACDELGLFVIVPTPGWQFHQKGVFERRVLADIRQTVRRDRNRASVFAWEPVLNETHYPEQFAAASARAVHEEFPNPQQWVGSDAYAPGAAAFNLWYGSSDWALKRLATGRIDHNKKQRDRRAPEGVLPARYHAASFFQREFGDNVNDWYGQDSTSRVDRAWGEAAQLVQVGHYQQILARLYKRPAHDVGGCLWHPFDHQRGYHPDPFWGGLLDARRQPKYSYWLFAAQRDPTLEIAHVDSGPFVKILHETNAVSSPHVKVASNCERVRLTVYGKDAGARPTELAAHHGMRGVVTFQDAYDFMEQKRLHRARRFDQAKVRAEGLIGDQVVAVDEVSNPRKRTKIVLKADHAGAALVADGSDIVPVVAYMTDAGGRVERTGENRILFTVEGAGSLIGSDDAQLNINPQTTRWGEAVALVRSTTKPGTITLRAAEVGPARTHGLEPAQLTLRSVAPRLPQLVGELPSGTRTPSRGTTARRTARPSNESTEVSALRAALQEAERELVELRVRETARTQEARETSSR